MTIEALKLITIRLGGKAHILEPGQTIELPRDKAMLLLERAPGRVRPVDLSTVIQSDALIRWTRLDGTVQEGFVDYVYVDDTGTRWAFISLFNGTWAVVNLKFVKMVTT